MIPARLHLLAVAGVVVLTVAAAPLARAQEPDEPDDSAVSTEQQELLDEGEQLYETSCSTCHGADGEGVEETDGGVRGPSLQEAGEASAYFYLSTGRMPLANSADQPDRNDPVFSDREIEALVAYVASLGDGPALPLVNPEDGNLAQGGVIYRSNCQGCHGAAGTGGALSYGRAAPRLDDATSEQVGAAVRSGPGQMPVFGPEVVSDQGLDDLTRYVLFLRDPDHPGGLPIGRTGPIPEGFVAWLVGMVALIGLVCWIGTRSPVREKHADDGVDADADTDADTDADSDSPAPEGVGP